MTDAEHLLDSKQMALFVAKGMLHFDELIPDELNRALTKLWSRRKSSDYRLVVHSRNVSHRHRRLERSFGILRSKISLKAWSDPT